MIRLTELELDQAIPSLGADERPTGILVRLHGRPLGIVEIEPLEADMDSTELELRVVAELSATISAQPSEADVQAERRAFAERAPFASVVVATRDRPERLAGCLESLLELDYPRFEVIVVDNAPQTDATARLVEDRFAER